MVSGLDIPGHSKGIDDSTDRFNFSLRNRNCKQRCGPQSNMFKTPDANRTSNVSRGQKSEELLVETLYSFITYFCSCSLVSR